MFEMSMILRDYFSETFIIVLTFSSISSVRESISMFDMSMILPDYSSETFIIVLTFSYQFSEEKYLDV